MNPSTSHPRYVIILDTHSGVLSSDLADEPSLKTIVYLQLQIETNRYLQLQVYDSTFYGSTGVFL